MAATVEIIKNETHLILGDTRIGEVIDILTADTLPNGEPWPSTIVFDWEGCYRDLTTEGREILAYGLGRGCGLIEA